jgi:hypothetical protein
VLPVEHVLVTPSGVWVILVKKQPGQFSYDGRRWHQKASFLRVFTFLSEPSLGKPIRDLERDLALVRDRLAAVAGSAEVPLEGVIVFTDPRASLEVKGTSCPVITQDNLTAFFRRELRKRPVLEAKLMRESIEVLEGWSS